MCDGAVVAGGAGRLPVVELLLQRGAKVEQGRHAKALHHAAAHEDVEVRTHTTLGHALHSFLNIRKLESKNGQLHALHRPARSRVIVWA